MWLRLDFGVAFCVLSPLEVTYGFVAVLWIWNCAFLAPKIIPIEGLGPEMGSSVACPSFLSAGQMRPCGDVLEPNLSRQLHGEGNEAWSVGQGLRLYCLRSVNQTGPFLLAVAFSLSLSLTYDKIFGSHCSLLQICGYKKILIFPQCSFCWNFIMLPLLSSRSHLALVRFGC